MTLHHFPHQAADGIWHAIYQGAATTFLSSIGEALTLSSAKHMCDDANREQAAMARAAVAEAVHSADRRILRGFYTDGDAA